MDDIRTRRQVTTTRTIVLKSLIDCKFTHAVTTDIRGRQQTYTTVAIRKRKLDDESSRGVRNKLAADEWDYGGASGNVVGGGNG